MLFDAVSVSFVICLALLLCAGACIIRTYNHNRRIRRNRKLTVPPVRGDYVVVKVLRDGDWQIDSIHTIPRRGYHAASLICQSVKEEKVKIFDKNGNEL